MQKEVYEFIARKMADPIVSRQTCRVSSEPFAIFQSDIDFLEKVSPIFAGKKYQIPLPTLCPEERQRRRLLFRNERKLYKRKCDFSGKEIVSVYSPEKPYKVYDQKIWWSDVRDGLEYGISFDSSRSFIEQFDALMKRVPKICIVQTNCDNSEYAHLSLDLKDCYLCFATTDSEACYYDYQIFNSTSCIDSSFCSDCAQCYEAIDAKKCYRCYFVQNCLECSHCEFCLNCSGCVHCFMCANLQNKSYVIQNKVYSKEEFESKMEVYKGKSHDEIEKMARDFFKIQIYENTTNFESQNVFGNFLRNCTNCSFCYDIPAVENGKYIFGGYKETKDTMDCCFSGQELGYENMSIAIGHKNAFCAVCWDSSYCFYCNDCYTCQNCFGCVGLRNKSYCILNKQYTKQEYETLVPKIIEHMCVSPDKGRCPEGGGVCERGEFFPPTLSPFCYNETVAQEYFPLTRDEALARCYKRQDTEYPINVPEGIETIAGTDVSQKRLYNPYSDDILTKAIICEVSGRPFRIVKQELEFYRRHGLPLPSKHPDVRHAERIAKRPKRELFLRQCDTCGKEMVSVYPSFVPPATERSPDSIGDKGRRPEGGGVGQQKVYCEDCYSKEVYG